MLGHDQQNNTNNNIEDQTQKPESLMDLLGPEEFEIRPGYNEKPEAPDLIPMEQQIENIKKSDSDVYRPYFSNFYEEETKTKKGDVKKIKVAYTVDELVAMTKEIIGDIFLLGEELYCINNGKLYQLSSDDMLYATLYDKATVDWVGTVSKSPKKSEFRTLLRMRVQTYNAVSCVPQTPIQSNVKYLANIKPRETGKCREFIEQFFFPHTEADKKLMMAALISPFYSMSSKPFLLFDTVQGGQCSGKTKVAEKLAEIGGGCVRLPEEAFKRGSTTSSKAYEKLLLKNEMAKVTVLIDNIVNQLDSSTFAEMITANDFSCRVAYGSDSSAKVNNLTFFGTTNISKICRDAATRTVKINLDPPPNDAGFATWEKRISKYIKENRDDVIADALYILERNPEYELTQRMRGPHWYLDVLSKFCDSQKEFDGILAGLVEDIYHNDAERETAETYSRAIEDWMDRHEQQRVILKDKPLFITKQAVFRMLSSAGVIEDKKNPNHIKAKISEWVKSGILGKFNKTEKRSERIYAGGPRGFLYNTKVSSEVEFIIDWSTTSKKCYLTDSKGNRLKIALYPPIAQKVIASGEYTDE